MCTVDQLRRSPGALFGYPEELRRNSSLGNTVRVAEVLQEIEKGVGLDGGVLQRLRSRHSQELADAFPIISKSRTFQT